ncbi:hypothetical protein BAUCODRAFT_52487, partial [Baudoinia panamericana UAMH 10762]
LKLPLELRQQILSYLLPRTRELEQRTPVCSQSPTRLFRPGNSDCRPVVVKPDVSRHPSPPTTNVVWLLGNTKLFSVCRQLHDECAELVYGRSTFLLILTYSGIKWRCRWLYSTGRMPTRHCDFLELVPERYLRLIKRVVVNIEHVDSYTGMIKFNVSGKGLTHGLRRQVQRLVNVL